MFNVSVCTSSDMQIARTSIELSRATSLDHVCVALHRRRVGPFAIARDVRASSVLEIGLHVGLEGV